MKLTDIEQRIHKTGIAELNPLQLAVRACTAQQIVMLAPTGTGKTLAFAIPLLKAVTPDAFLQAVIIAPSRELVMQIRDVLQGLCSGYCRVMAVYGGSRFESEANSLRGSVPQILVGTPGRLLDHIRRGTLSVETARAFVIDEFDKILSLGFEDEVRRILARLGAARVRILTSATAPDKWPAYLDMSQAETVDFTATAGEAVRITVVEVPSAVRDKLDTLASLLRSPQTGSAIVFVNHRESAERVVESLSRRGIPATLYHGGLDQRQREIAVAKVRAGVARVLVATDLAARGLDLEAGIDSVIHYHIPVDEAAWTHRNGRTARAGATGNVYVITGPDEPIPDYISFARTYYPQSDPDAPGPQAGPHPRQQPGTSPDCYRSSSTDNGASPANGASPLSMLYIQAGKQDKISKGDIAGFLMKVCGLAPSEVGLITVARDYSLAAVATPAVSRVLAAARAGARLKGHRARLSLA
ncbi:MAG: DEAD/DEAH box helicase [Muribaculaceae bacterium]